MTSDDTQRRDPLMLKFGLGVFRRWSEKTGTPVALDEVHLLNPDEQRELKRIESRAIWRGAGIGTLSALICAISWPAAIWIAGAPPGDVAWYQQWPQYLVMGTILAVATLIEILLLYWNALYSVHRMAYAAGLKLFGTDWQPHAVMNALVSAALELPHTREETLYARPGREISRWWIVLVTVLYRLKVTVSYYIARALVQRFLGRVVVRWAIELVAVPIYAFWDALVTWFVLRQARVCAMGPSAVRELSEKIQQQDVRLGEQAQTAIVCAVGATVARNSHLHPNVELLLRELANVYGIPRDQDIDDSQSLVDLLQQLKPVEQQIVLETLTLAMIIDGRASIWERRLLQLCLSACGLSDNLTPLRDGLRSFRRGQPIDLDALVPMDAR